ncbi:MAG: hypothetical protein INQ03_08610 [Candidatus Heimdallarchaeota archaeon]|nr:hypothetical protein [Candidatus Heimdallarchaeota archaeon]
MLKDKEDEQNNLFLDTLRVIPTQYKVTKQVHHDKLSDLLAILLVFGVAVFVRFYVRDIFISNYGDHLFYMVIPEGDPYGIGAYTGIAVGDTLYLEGYDDFHYYYLDYVNYLLEGWNPYSGSITPDDHLGGYVYGPFYIYSISIGKAWFDLSAYDSIVYSNIVFDSLCYVLVYILAKRITGNVIALFVALLGSFSPIALFYANIRGLNAPAMTFFALVFVYYYLERKDGRAIFFLALATMTKQFPLFFALPMGFWMMRRYGIIKGIALILLFVFDVILLSLPWILYTPRDFVIKYFLPGGGKDQLVCPQGGEATNLVHGGLVDICAGNEGKLVPDSLAPGYVNVMDILVNNHLLFFFLVFVFGWIAFTSYDYLEQDHKYYMRFQAAFYTIVHATIARGIYKYYLTMLVPFILLAFTPGNPAKSMNLRLGAMLNRSFSSYFDPKNRIRKPDPYYWIGFLILLIGVFSIFWVISASVTLFTQTMIYYKVWMVILIPLSLYTIYKPSPLGFEETDEQISFDTLNSNLPVGLILGSISLYYLMKVAQVYFSDEQDYRSNMYIIVGIVIIFLILPQVEKLAFKKQSTFNFFQLNLEQLVKDIIFLLIGFIVINFFHIEVLTINRLQTTTVVLFMAVVLTGMLEGEVLLSTYKVPVNAFRKYMIIRNTPHLSLFGYLSEVISSIPAMIASEK